MFALWLAYELWSLDTKLLFNWLIAVSLAYLRDSNDFKKSLSYRLTYSDIGERFGWQVSWWQFWSPARALKDKRAPPSFFKYHPNQASAGRPNFFRKSTSSSVIVPKVVVFGRPRLRPTTRSGCPRPRTSEKYLNRVPDRNSVTNLIKS